MSVFFTNNIGLAKPDNQELAKEWVTVSNLMDDNNVIIETKANLTFQSYIPTFVGTTTNPNVGAGFVSGEYVEIQGFIYGSFIIRFIDPGTSAGSGTGGYGISLPVNADPVFHTIDATLSDNPGFASCVGEGFIVDASSTTNTGTIALDLVQPAGTTYLRMITETFTGKTQKFFLPGQPFTFADQDRITGTFFYKKA
jgi:hypothetical protein